MFQSLFFWNGLWDALHFLRQHVQKDVSILVFLEWPLGRGLELRNRQLRDEFQSLFFWNGLWDFRAADRRQRREWVSILVFLEWPLGQAKESANWP